ncbi:3-beta hydroxysteroid dehydrogenase [Streptomyces spiroverticillatus]|uniref:3-beta hydroxysteroid dehydrogenase n=1 Tax=Streptomyces finlayi TaxID=67296 RepID=A0A918WWS1_9ACTN|nr:NAD(P)H-binding protein [Streptomyces finlayi]GHA08767.1 3-beta hydroxysteroid dehydrogenase [Streptomyces spiroverticillatus]GHC91638.1 3-beta hydroxysteroid dehydrogenase [Streptomyces finlayi]
MRITVFGATGAAGSRIVAEAVGRGHDVTAVTRDPARFDALHPGARPAAANALDPDAVAELAAGQDLLIGVTRPVPGQEGQLAETARALVAGAARTGARLLVVGGAGSLRLPGSDTLTVIDGPDFPPSWRPIALACNEQLEVVRAAGAGVDWVYVSPSALFAPGERTGAYRLGTDELLVSPAGESAISMEDFALAVLDEAERPKHQRVRFTVGY